MSIDLLGPPGGSAWRRRCFRALFSPTSFVERFVALLTILAICASVGIAMAETMPQLTPERRGLLSRIQIGLGLVFVTEYALRFWCIVEDPRFAARGGRLRYLLTPLALIDLLAIVPLLLPTALGDEWIVLRTMRILRIASILRVGRYSVAMQTFGTVIASRRGELGALLLVAAVLLILAASLMHMVEGRVQPEKFGSIPASLWWSIITLTTIGYGDVYPITTGGKVLGGFIALLGIGLVAVPTGIIAGGFQEAYLARRRRARHEGDRSVVCPHCGERIEREQLR